MNVVDFLNYRMEKTAKAGKAVKKVVDSAPKKPAPKKPSIPLKPSLKKAILSKDTAKGAIVGSLMSPALFMHGPSGMAIPDALIGPALGGTAGTVKNYLKQKKDIKKAKEAAKALAAAGATGTVATQVKTAASKSQLAMAKEMLKSPNRILRARGRRILAKHKAGRTAAREISQATNLKVDSFPYEGDWKKVLKYKQSARRNIARGQNPKGFINLKPRMDAVDRRNKVDRYVGLETMARVGRLEKAREKAYKSGGDKALGKFQRKLNFHGTFRK